MRFKAFCLSVAVFLLLAACVSTPLTEQDRDLIRKQKKYFSTCKKIDGGNYFSVQKNQKDLFAARMDWITDGSGNTSIELSNTIGGFLGGVEFGPSKLELEGLPDDLRLTVDSAGFINIKGHRLGVKTAELPCILSFSLPSEWLENPIEKTTDQEGVKFGFTAESRAVSWWSQQTPSKTRVCVKIEWSTHFLLPASNIDWCYQLKPSSSSGKLNVQGLYRFLWETSDSLGGES